MVWKFKTFAAEKHYSQRESFRLKAAVNAIMDLRELVRLQTRKMSSSPW